MSFTLEVRITGICLFVPQPKEEPPRVTVLMPITTGHQEHEEHKKHKVDPHRTVLVHHRDFAASTCAEIQGDWCVHRLDNTQLTLSDWSELHEHLPGVYKLNRQGFRRKAPRNAGPSQGVQAKVILESGYCEYVAPGARFKVDGAYSRMPYEVHWVLPDMNDSALRLYDLTTGALAATIGLTVQDGTRAVIYLRCVPPTEVKPGGPHLVPANPIEADHFTALDSLLVSGHDAVGAPKWEKNPGDEPPPHTAIEPMSAATPTRVIGNPYTCMPGQTDPDGP